MSDASVGEMLRTAREQRGDSLEVANRETKISTGVIEALEQDDFTSFQSDIYLKNFLRTYAQYLELDAGDVMAALERQRGGGARGASGATWDVEEQVVEEKIRSPRIFKRFVLPLLLILIILLTLLFINERRKVSRLTTDQAQGYLDEEAADVRAG